MRRSAPTAVALFIAVAACSGSSLSPSNPQSSSSVSEPSTQPSPSAATGAPFPFSSEPLAIEPGTYRIAESPWSVADFTVTFPEGWTVQYGHVFAKNTDTIDEFGFYAVVVDEIYADACMGDTGALLDAGQSVDDLVTALLQQPGPMATGPRANPLGGYPAKRVDLTIPAGFDLEACSLGSIGLQIWYAPPADKYFVLLPDEIASVYIVDVDSQRQVFLVGHGLAASDEVLAELQAVLDSIHVEASEVVQGWPATGQNPPGVYSWDGSSCAGQSCNVGFMHNGYGSGYVDITIETADEEANSDDGGEAVTVAGHDGIYHRIDARTEEWIVNIEGTAIAIRLKAEGGTTPTELAEAHAIIDSMRTEKRDTQLGFRLVFTLRTDDWDSG